MKTIESYNHIIYTGDESIRFLPEVISKIKPSQIIFLYDDNTFKYCAPIIKKLLYSVRYLKQFDSDLIKTITIPSGEKNKNFETVSIIIDKLIDFQADRKSLLVCIGGGVLCDIGNFTASIWKRGIDCLLVPTSLLAMVDASCGGKTGVNFKNYKNLIGTFSTPKAVICDPIFMQTLPHRELISGYAEMLKHAIIANKIQDFIDNETIDYKSVSAKILPSIEIKNNIILQDWREENLRKILNFGHTIGHALEKTSLSTETPLLHGEAVALGMLAEANLAYNLNKIDYQLFKNIKTIIERFFLNYKFPFKDDEIINIMINDKKNLSKKIVFALPCPEKFIELDFTNDKEQIIKALKIIH